MSSIILNKYVSVSIFCNLFIIDIRLIVDKSACLDFLIHKFIYGFNNLLIVNFEGLLCNIVVEYEIFFEKVETDLQII